MIGIETPEDKGGWGGDFLTHMIATEERAYANVPGNFLLQVSKKKYLKGYLIRLLEGTFNFYS